MKNLEEGRQRSSFYTSKVICLEASIESFFLLHDIYLTASVSSEFSD